MIKIDDYVIYENEGPEEEDSEVSMNLDNDLDEEFTEKSKKNEKKIKASGNSVKNILKKKEKIVGVLGKICLICSKDKISNSELYSFKSIEDFLGFLKKTYESNEGNVKETEEYTQNKQVFSDYFANFHKHYSSDYVFKTVKYICKHCFNYNLGIKGGFDNLFTALHVSFQPISEKKEEITSQVNMNNYAKQSNFGKSSQGNITISNTQAVKQNNVVKQNTTTVSFNNKNNETLKLMHDLSVKTEEKQIEKGDRVELNVNHSDNKKVDVNSGINKILDLLNNGNKNVNTNNIAGNTSNNTNNPSQNAQNNNNPVLKFLLNQPQNTSNLPTNPLLNQSSFLNQLSMNSSNLISQLPLTNNLNPLPQINTNINNNSLNSLATALTSMQQNNPLLQSQQGNMLLQQVMNLTQQPQTQLTGGNQQPQNLGHVTNNIGKLVEIISQYNQKHLNQNASMISNINNLVSTMSNMVPQEKKDNPPSGQQESHKETTEKKENVQEKPQAENQNLQGNPEEKKDVNSLLANLDSSKNNLSSYMFNVLDELKKQIYSIQYYSLVQKLFISYIFKNLDIFIEQLASNQALSSLNNNPFLKGQSGLGGLGENINGLSDQLTLLKKIAENLAVNQMNNPLLNAPNIEELSNLLGGQTQGQIPNLNQLSQLLNPGNTNNPFNLLGQSQGSNNIQSGGNITNNNSLLNNGCNNNTGGNLSNNNKLPLQAINKILDKGNSLDLNNLTNLTNNLTNTITNTLNNQGINQPQLGFSGQTNNMLEQLLKNIKNNQQNQGQNPQMGNPGQGQIIMPINIETNSTNIIQNPANQLFGMTGNNQQQSGLNHHNNHGLNSNLLMHLNGLVGQGIQQPFGQQNNLMGNPNLMSLLMQNPGNLNLQQQFQNNNMNQK